MSKLQRVAVVTAWTVILTCLLSVSAPAVQADGDPASAKVAKKAKPAKSSEKKADKKSAGKPTSQKKADSSKPQADDELDEFKEASAASHSAKKVTEKTAKADNSATIKVFEHRTVVRTAAKAAKLSTTVVRFSLNGEYPEGPTEPGLFGDLQPSLGKFIQRLDEAKGDKDVRAVWLRIDDPQLGRGKVNEVRAAIARIRKAGKPVYAELTSADSGGYLVASPCDKIFMPVSGMLIVPGVRAEVTFYKGLLDKLGLKFDALQMGKFKGAAEPLSRSNMSAPLRESLQAIVDDTYDHMVATIAKDRRLADYQVKSLIDQGLFSATSAQEAGLIDEVLYADEFEESLPKQLKVDRVTVETAYKKKQIDSDFSGLGGFVKLMEAFSGGKKSETSGTKQKIAVVYAVGEITEGKSHSGMFGGSSLGSTTMVETLKKVFADRKVAAVVLRIDSPGGSATASDLIWRAAVRGKKPLVASMGNVAGSGGYYIAMGAKKIFAEPGTLTGSIGVIGGKLVTGGLYDKLGMNTEIISRGKNSGALSSTQPFSPEERRAWTKLLKETYHEFVSKAAQGRKMSYDRLEAMAQGRVYTGRQAKKLGLVDEIGTLQDAVAEAKKLAGLKPGADVEIEVLPQPKPFFEQLFEGEGADASELSAALPDVVKIVRQTALWRQLLGEKVLLWMPYRIELK